MTIKVTVRKVHWVLSTQFGINLILFSRAFREFPFYLRQYWQFCQDYRGAIQFYPCLHDRNVEGGSTKNEYFWQDLLVARWIYEAKPQRHVDIGSRVDGFVAHVASFREIEVFDVRPITTQIPGVVFRQADLMNSEAVELYTKNRGYCDSLSCLHAIEHFGLGRYGDPINPLGYALGLEIMSNLLEVDGRFYLSTPIGRERVEFNANWVFDPKTIINIAESKNLKLIKMTIFNPKQKFQNIEPNEENLNRLANEAYSLAIFVFLKI